VLVCAWEHAQMIATPRPIREGSTRRVVVATRFFTLKLIKRALCNNYRFSWVRVQATECYTSQQDPDQER